MDMRFDIYFKTAILTILSDVKKSKLTIYKIVINKNHKNKLNKNSRT